jgi:hypothetical protein
LTNAIRVTEVKEHENIFILPIYLFIYLFFNICKRRHAPENNVQYVERYSVTKEEKKKEHFK